jgi:hypothetical protein
MSAPAATGGRALTPHQSRRVAQRDVRWQDRRMPRTIVLVHGAWHGAWCWAPLQATLDAASVALYLS